MKHDANAATRMPQKPKPKPEGRPARVAPPAASGPTFSTRETEAAGRREHGDSYGEISAREEDFGVTTSSHGGAPDRRPEEPSEAPLDAPERLEGST